MALNPKKTLGRVASKAALGFTDFLGIAPIPGKNHFFQKKNPLFLLYFFEQNELF